MTAQGHPRAIFKRAIERSNVAVAEATARELGRLSLEEARQLLLLYAACEPARFRTRGDGWHARFITERAPSLLQAQIALSGLSELRTCSDASKGVLFQLAGAARPMLPTNTSEEAEMAVFMGAFPVLAGKEGEPRKFAEETLGRRDEFDASQQRCGITKESWVLQESPEGSLVIVHFESDDVEGAFTSLAQSDDSFDVWFKDRVKEITGVDLNESGGPLPQIILDWSS